MERTQNIFRILFMLFILSLYTTLFLLPSIVHKF